MKALEILKKFQDELQTAIANDIDLDEAIEELEGLQIKKELRMSCEINRMQSYTCNYELKKELEKRNFKYIHSDLLYYGSIGINLEDKTFYSLAVTIYPKFSDEKILSILDGLDDRSRI